MPPNLLCHNADWYKYLRLLAWIFFQFSYDSYSGLEHNWEFENMMWKYKSIWIFISLVIVSYLIWYLWKSILHLMNTIRNRSSSTLDHWIFMLFPEVWEQWYNGKVRAKHWLPWLTTVCNSLTSAETDTNKVRRLTQVNASDGAHNCQPNSSQCTEMH